ncbi:MAG: glycosyltransferase family 2 protein [Bacteroidales bacterium]|nr:glycosyltransferase family 2 protein [Bacteroidales bacterium]
MASPLVTVIIPIYNSAAKLERCIQSVLDQSFRDWELLLVDNGSHDGSYEIMSTYATRDSRIKALQENRRGVSAARNMGLNNARGEFISFIDSDDYVSPNFLASLLEYKQYELVMCGYIVENYDSSFHVISRIEKTPGAMVWHKADPQESMAQQFKQGFMHFCWNKLFKKSIIDRERIRFKNIPVNEDYIFVMQYLKHAVSVASVSAVNYTWTREPGMESGVESIPDNLIEIYNDSHLLTREFFSDTKIADLIAFYSYELLVYKAYKARKWHKMTKREMYAFLSKLSDNDLARSSWKIYVPATPISKILHHLIKRGLYRPHFLLTQKLLNRL